MPERNSLSWVQSWGPYWLPMLAFLALHSISQYAPDSAEPWLLALRVLVPGAIFFAYACRGSFPELRGAPLGPGATAADVGVGVLGAALWIAPYLLFPALRPDTAGFDPAVLGEARAPLALALRALGFVVVTPFIEELFVRSWLMRYAEVYNSEQSFRRVPIAHFSWRSFLVVTAYFVFSHAPWEYGVMLVWTLLTMAWFYRRGHLAPLVLVHAVTNASILLFVLLFDGVFAEEGGAPLSLWFFL